MVLASSWFQLAPGGFSKFSIISGGFRPSFVLVNTNRLNVDLDLMCCLISFCTNF